MAADSSSVRRTPRWCPGPPGRGPLAVRGGRTRGRAGWADRLQCGGIGTGGEPVGQFAEPDTVLGGLAFGPFVAVEPDLDRVREVGADLDERRPEIGVPQIEIETRPPPVGLGERKPRNPVVARALRRGEHVLKLLRRA